MGAAGAFIDYAELLEREVEAGGLLLDPGLELAVLERHHLTEERQDENREDGHVGDQDESGKSPQVKDKVTSRLLNDLEGAGNGGNDDGTPNSLGLDEVRDEGLWGCLVEAKRFLEHKGLIERGRHGQELLQQGENQDKNDGVGDLAGEALRSPAEQQVAGPGPQLGQDIELDEGDVDDLRPQAADEGEASLGAAVGV